MRSLPLFLAALTSVQVAIFADAAKSEDSIGGGRNELVDSVFRECEALLRERRKAGVYLTSCDIEKAVPFDLEATCGIAVDNFRLAKEELDHIFTRCVPDYIFGDYRYSSQQYFVKSVVIKNYRKIYDVDDRVYFFYTLEKCDSIASFSGFAYHRSIKYLYFSAAIPTNCVIGD